jgi:hypothetical protein
LGGSAIQVRVRHSSLLLLFVGLFLSGIIVGPAHAQSAPQISSISPTLGGVGAAAYVYGSNFGSTQGPSTVTFNGTAGTPSYWSNTQINVPVPSGATTGPVDLDDDSLGTYNGIDCSGTTNPAWYTGSGIHWSQDAITSLMNIFGTRN